MSVPWPPVCPVCSEELPERGNRRLPIPWLGGRVRLVHAACAPLVDAQGQLSPEPEPSPQDRDEVLLGLGEIDAGEAA